MSKNTNPRVASHEVIVKAATIPADIVKQVEGSCMKRLKDANVKLVDFLTDVELKSFLGAVATLERAKSQVKSAQKLMSETMRPMIVAQFARMGLAPITDGGDIHEVRRKQISEVFNMFRDLVKIALPHLSESSVKNALSSEFKGAGYLQRNKDKEVASPVVATGPVVSNIPAKTEAVVETTVSTTGETGIHPGMSAEQLAEALLAMGYVPSVIQSAASTAQKLAAAARQLCAA